MHYLRWSSSPQRIPTNQRSTRPSGNFEIQLNAAHVGSHNIWTIVYDLYMTHGDKKLGLDGGDDEIRRAQDEINSERVEEYTFPSICSLELDSPV